MKPDDPDAIGFEADAKEVDDNGLYVVPSGGGDDPTSSFSTLTT